ncbi:hypothetical protein B0H13DRAFT_2301380 [Mycena leptocephala]|nr:hypothetical protein B0H13DRAFT_2301380 [Mycena leptocephala]
MFSKVLAFAPFTLAIAHTTPPSHIPLADALFKITVLRPVTSTDVERSFSGGGLTVSKMGHSLSDESTRAATVLGSWVDVADAIPRLEIIENIKNKASRLKTVEGSTNAIVVDDSGHDE